MAVKANVIGEVEAEFHKEVDPSVNQVEMGCPHVGNLFCWAREEHPDACNKTQVGMKPVLRCHQVFVFFIEFQCLEFQGAPFSDGDVLVRIILGGRGSCEQGRCEEGVEGDVSGPVCFHCSYDLGWEPQVMAAKKGQVGRDGANQ